jgi:hypothetical protein
MIRGHAPSLNAVLPVSAGLAVLFMLPLLNEFYDWGWQNFYGLTIVVTGLDYLRVFFHEIGHAIAAWSFGRPALPSFDFAHGGGMTYWFDYSALLSLLVYAGWAAGVFWLWRALYPGLSIALAATGLIHAGLLLAGGAEAAISFMGHGFEILLAGFLLVLTLARIDTGRAVDPYLNATFAFFIFGGNALMCRMMFSDIGQSAYAQQKGGHVQGDLQKLADAWNTGLEGAAVVYLVFMLATLAAAVALGLWMRRSSDA